MGLAIRKGLIMRNINYRGRKAICSICVILALWPLGGHAATLPPDPDNAALLYYQAFLLRPEPDADTSASIDDVVRGGEPDENLRKYLNLQDCLLQISRTRMDVDLWDSTGFRTHSPTPLVLCLQGGQLSVDQFLLQHIRKPFL